MELKSLDQLGRVEREIELGDHKFQMHTLSVLEQQRAIKNIPDDVDDDAEKFSYLMVSVLSQATAKINDESISIDKLKHVYNNMQYNMLSRLFAKYLELSTDQTKIVDELKKN